MIGSPPNKSLLLSHKTSFLFCSCKEKTRDEAGGCEGNTESHEESGEEIVEDTETSD
jgi:hypothetical protein